ncbi:MAG: glycosyltransferase family 2 protein [Flavobacterium sp.]|nr:glycosyltransferase family 2 protein [Flavobacterium sp.]
MKTLTVFTPTFNRAYCLGICYESLVKQTSHDFEWLIIDDGSTDETKSLVQSWINENKIEIKYHFKPNGGMHTGHNVAHKLIETELNVCIDSDDFMPNDSVEKIISLWRKYGSNSYAGLVGLDATTDGKIIGVPFPTDLKECTYAELQPKYKITGDKKSVYRTEIIKKYEEYPFFEGEKFVPLYLPIVIDRDYKVLCFNEVFCIVEYQNDGSTLNIFKQYVKNPKGFAQQRKILMEYVPFQSVKFRNAIHYVSSSLLSQNWNFISESPQKLLTILAILPGILLYFYVKYRNRK